MKIKRTTRQDTGVGEVQPISRHEFFNEQLRRKFMKLPLVEKNLVKEAQAAGFQWKGEDTHRRHKHLGDKSHFEHAFSEYKIMREIGVTEYRKRALARVDAYTRRVVAQSQRPRT